MNKTTELPLSLFKANLELQVRIGKLIQEAGQQWLDYGNRLLGDGIAESNAEVEELLKVQDWQKLAALPAESFWRQLQQRFGDGQAVTQIAISAQTAFASGLQDALKTWQKETAEALGGSLPTAPSGDSAWIDLFKPWQQLLSSPFAEQVPDAKPAGTGKGRKNG